MECKYVHRDSTFRRLNNDLNDIAFDVTEIVYPAIHNRPSRKQSHARREIFQVIYANRIGEKLDQSSDGLTFVITDFLKQDDIVIRVTNFIYKPVDIGIPVLDI